MFTLKSMTHEATQWFNEYASDCKLLTWHLGMLAVQHLGLHDSSVIRCCFSVSVACYNAKHCRD